MKNLTTKLAIAFAATSTFLRLLPTFLLWPFNLAPVGGLALFNGARLRSWLAYALPLAVMVVTDCILWALFGRNYSPLHFSRPFVYGGFLVYVVLGRVLLSGTSRPLTIGGVAILGSLQFYLLTNFAAWLELSRGALPTYSPDLPGLLHALAAGLPFYDRSFPIGFLGFTVLGDLVFTAAFFAIHALATSEQPAAAVQPVSEQLTSSS
ncbi:MAG: hypothetical protein L0Y72_20945 [Gemmataceae bacterium]|nr:hypothetical protein [Gemmataceae bacterium]MCI0741509.1 hypothetical protein [Gemmataceae bacterium]